MRTQQKRSSCTMVGQFQYRLQLVLCVIKLLSPLLTCISFSCMARNIKLLSTHFTCSLACLIKKVPFSYSNVIVCSHKGNLVGSVAGQCSVNYLIGWSFSDSNCKYNNLCSI